MQTENRQKSGFTLVEMMVVVAVIGLLAGIAIPNFVQARVTSQMNACINNLRQIDAGKQEWGLSGPFSATTKPGKAELQPYLGRGANGELPTCPIDPRTPGTPVTLPAICKSFQSAESCPRPTFSRNLRRARRSFRASAPKFNSQSSRLRAFASALTACAAHLVRLGGNFPYLNCIVQVRVHFYSYFKDLAGSSEVTEAIAPGSRLDALLQQVFLRFPKLAAMRKSALVAVGVDYQAGDYILADGDEVSLFPPVQGG